MTDQAVELTDENIETLLLEAEARLASKNAPEKQKVSVSNSALAAPPAAITEETAPEKKSTQLTVRTPHLAAKVGKAKDDAGEDWYHLPRTKLTPELKRDLQIIRMRGILDSKQKWRKDTRKDFVPEFSAVGTLVEGPLDVKNGRLTRRERKRTMVEEVLGNTEANAKFRTRYGAIQSRKMSGRKGHYKKLVAQRRRWP